MEHGLPIIPFPFAVNFVRKLDLTYFGRTYMSHPTGMLYLRNQVLECGGTAIIFFGLWQFLHMIPEYNTNFGPTASPGKINQSVWQLQNTVIIMDCIVIRLRTLYMTKIEVLYILLKISYYDLSNYLKIRPKKNCRGKILNIKMELWLMS